MGEVAAVDEPDRGWFEPSCGLKLLRLRCCSGLCEGPIMNYEPLNSGLDKTWKAIASSRDAVYQDQGRGRFDGTGQRSVRTASCRPMCRLYESSSLGRFMQLVECAGLLTMDEGDYRFAGDKLAGMCRALGGWNVLQGVGGDFLSANVVRNSTKGEVETYAWLGSMPMGAPPEQRWMRLRGERQRRLRATAKEGRGNRIQRPDE
jgi:hypothetical protein